MAYSDQELHNAATQLAQALNTLHGKVEALEAKPGVDRFKQEVADSHDFLRSRGLSPEQISKGEARMAQRGNANYQDAYQLGYFGAGKPVIGGIAADKLQRMMNGDYEAVADELTEEALADCRGWGR
jgi:hypothetical protein